MEIGAVEKIGTVKTPKIGADLMDKLRASGGESQNFSGGGGNRSDDEFFEESEYPSNKFRILTWFLLLVVLMTFGGLMGAYVVVSTNGVLEWRPFDLPRQVWISTVLLLLSSFTYYFANISLKSSTQQRARNYYLATTVLGAMFIASQLLAWVALIQHGIYVKSNPYAGFFFVLTAIHAAHVIGGIIALGYVVLRTWDPTLSPEELKTRRIYSASIGWYWHFMGAIWIVLLALLGFWK